MKKSLAISALALTASALLTSCASSSPEWTSPGASTTTSAVASSRPTVDPSVASAVPQPKTVSDSKLAADAKNAATEVETYLVSAKSLDGFSDFAKSHVVISKGNHLSISYAKNVDSDSYLIRVWNTDNPSHKDAENAYAYDPKAGGLKNGPYATPNGLTTTIDLTDSVTQK